MKNILILLMLSSSVSVYAANRDCRLFVSNVSKYMYDSSTGDFIKKPGFKIESKTEGDYDYLTIRGKSSQTGGLVVESKLTRNTKTKEPVEFINWQNERFRFEKSGEDCYPLEAFKIDEKTKKQTMIFTKDICRSVYKHFLNMAPEAQALTSFSDFKLDVVGTLGTASYACSKPQKPTICTKFNERAKTALSAEGVNIYSNALDKAYDFAKSCSSYYAVGDKRQPPNENIESNLWEDLMAKALKENFEWPTSAGAKSE